MDPLPTPGRHPYGGSQPRLGGDGAADGLGCVGDAASTAARDVDLHFAGRGDDERGVALALVDLPAGSGVIANFVDRQRFLAADAVDDLFRGGDRDRHVMQPRFGERAGVAGDHGDDEEREPDHRQHHGADGRAVARGMPLGGLVFSHAGDLSRMW